MDNPCNFLQKMKTIEDLFSYRLQLVFGEFEHFLASHVLIKVLPEEFKD